MCWPNACHPRLLLGRGGKRCPPKQELNLCLPRRLVGIGVICQWSLRPPVLTLMSLVSCQLEDWVGPLASQGFLAGGHGLFCLLPELLTFEDGPLAAHVGEGLGSCSFWPTASWCLAPHLAASAQSPWFSPSLKITVLLHPPSKSSQSNKACPEPWLLPGLSVWGSDSARGNARAAAPVRLVVLTLALRGQLKVGLDIEQACQGVVTHTRSTWQMRQPATPPSSAGQWPRSLCILSPYPCCTV